jgi:hypothetical protein
MLQPPGPLGQRCCSPFDERVTERGRGKASKATTATCRKVQCERRVSHIYTCNQLDHKPLGRAVNRIFQGPWRFRAAGMMLS